MDVVINVTINHILFQNIREQMAISLKRMRELEEKVKLIPSLEIELHSLKNEKYDLLEKIERLKSTLEFTEKNLLRLKKDKMKEIEKVEDIKPVLKDVGVTCKVLTREVGITPVVLKNRTVGTETKMEQPPPPPIDLKPQINESVKYEKPILKSVKSQTLLKNDTKSTSTDLIMDDIEHILKKKETRLSHKHLDGISFTPRALEQLNKGSQTTVKEPETVLKVVEKREASIQVEQQKKLNRDAGTIAKPKMFDASIDARPKTRDYGSSDNRTNDLLCDKCTNLKTRSIGVGLGNVKVEEPKIDTTSIYRSKSFQLPETKPRVSTRHIGVGTPLPVKKLTSTKGVGTQDMMAIKLKRTGMNTVRVDVIDAESETEPFSNEKFVCDKCVNECKPLVKPRSSSTTTPKEKDDVKEPQPSKIPRPKSNQSTPVMERKKFMRQDTYTKIPYQPTTSSASSDLGKNSKTRLVVINYYT